MIQALIVDAMARDGAGNSAAAEVAIESALDLAERDTLVFPFLMTAPRSLLERHPRHSTAHAALLSDIIDLLAGAALKASPTTDELPEPLTGGELRVLRYLPSNISAPRDRRRAVRLNQHGKDPHAPYLRKAECPRPE